VQHVTSPETDRTAGVEPPLRHEVPWRLVSADPLPGFRLRVTFVDGTAGEVEMGNFLRGEAVRGTVFEALRDSSIFEKVTVVHGAAEWPNGADLAPDAMYEAIRKGGRWVL
jgi:hypothetical protein